MRKRIPSKNTLSPSDKKRTARGKTESRAGWEGEILLFLESEDPRLLDKEAYKVFCRLKENAARMQGPVPLPVRWPSVPSRSERQAGVHRRLFRIFFPTDATVSLLERLPLSSSVSASINVEDPDAFDPHEDGAA